MDMKTKFMDFSNEKSLKAQIPNISHNITLQADLLRPMLKLPQCSIERDFTEARNAVLINPLREEPKEKPTPCKEFFVCRPSLQIQANNRKHGTQGNGKVICIFLQRQYISGCTQSIFLTSQYTSVKYFTALWMKKLTFIKQKYLSSTARIQTQVCLLSSSLLLGNSAQCYVAARMERGLGRMDTCICMTESLGCSPETITTLLIDYNIK